MISHFGHLLVSFLESFHKGVDSLVELVEVHLHVLFLALEVFGLLISEEVFQLLLSSWSIVKLVRLLCRVRTLSSLASFFLLLVVEAPRIRVFLLHEAVPSLEGASGDVLSGLGEQVAQFQKSILGDTHKNNVRHGFVGSSGLLFIGSVS